MEGKTPCKEDEIMDQEKAAPVSPFSALTYQEQQDRWLEWRSRQLHYQPAAAPAPREAQAAPDKSGMPPLRVPNMRIAAPVRHRELDEVISRHRRALRQAGAFRTTAID